MLFSERTSGRGRRRRLLLRLLRPWLRRLLLRWLWLRWRLLLRLLGRLLLRLLARRLWFLLCLLWRRRRWWRHGLLCFLFECRDWWRFRRLGFRHLGQVGNFVRRHDIDVDGFAMRRRAPGRHGHRCDEQHVYQRRQYQTGGQQQAGTHYDAPRYLTLIIRRGPVE